MLEPCGDGAKMLVLIQRVCSGAQESAFLTISLAVLGLLVCGPHSENWGLVAGKEELSGTRCFDDSDPQSRAAANRYFRWTQGPNGSHLCLVGFRQSGSAGKSPAAFSPARFS